MVLDIDADLSYMDLSSILRVKFNFVREKMLITT